MADYVAIRAKVEAAGKVAWLGVIVDPGTKRTVELLNVVGSTADFTTHPLEEPFATFQAWVQEIMFYSRYEKAETSDLERWNKTTFQNLEYIDQLFRDFKKGSTSNLEFKLNNDLQIIMGDRNPRVAVKVERLGRDKLKPKEEEGADKPAAFSVDAAEFVPLTLVISPLRGTYLSSLQNGDDVIVKIKDRAHPRSQAFIAQLSEEDQELSEFTATLKDRKSNPAGGVYVFLAMPDGSAGLVMEEEPGIKVKRPGQMSTGPAAKAGSMPGAPTAAFDNPFVLIGIAAGVLVLVGIVVLVFVL